MSKRFGFLFALVFAMIFGAATGKGTITVSKDEKGGRDKSGNKKKNEKVRKANKEQVMKPDPNAPAK